VLFLRIIVKIKGYQHSYLKYCFRITSEQDLIALLDPTSKRIERYILQPSRHTPPTMYMIPPPKDKEFAYKPKTAARPRARAPTPTALPEAAPVDWGGVEPEAVAVGLEPEAEGAPDAPECVAEAAVLPVEGAVAVPVGMSVRVMPAEAQRPETAGMISVAILLEWLTQSKIDKGEKTYSEHLLGCTWWEHTA
jgi:hypothetical protein